MKTAKILKLLSVGLFCSLLLSCNIVVTSTSNTSNKNTSSEATSSKDTSEISDESSSSFESSSDLTSSTIPSDKEEELLVNTDFNSLSNWQIIESHSCVIKSKSHGNGELILDVNNSNATETWSAQMIQNAIPLKYGKEYKVDFVIKSSIDRAFNFVLQSMDYSKYLINEIIELKANQEYHFSRIVNCKVETSYLYGFLLGKINNTTNGQHEITIKNPSLIGEKVKQETEGLDGTTSEAPSESHGRKLVWSDEFNGSEVDKSKWSFEIGNGSGGWGNNELQYYTDRKENVRVDNGSLKITALNDRYLNYNYSSTRMISKDKYEFHYGYVEARLALPSMAGIWPAFWMLGANIDEVSWPRCGEIDIMEAINDESKVYSTLHWNENGHASKGNNGRMITDRTDYHIYGMEWTENSMVFYLDGVNVYNFGISSSNGTSAFQKDFFFIFNVAVGGNWPGFSIGTAFPQTMSVDYLRVYQ